MDLLLRSLLGLLPVTCFLAALLYLDSYKLVRVTAVLSAVAAGCVVAVVSYPLNVFVLESTGIEFTTLTRYFAPLIEEALKALVVIFLLYRNRFGFLVDAAIFGFAIGAGFAIFENLYYLRVLPDTTIGVWIVRGFGTAVMHGGATAIFAVVSQSLMQRGNYRHAALIPGYAVAVVVHSVFNHFFLSPVQTTLGVLIALPLLAAAIFRASEKAVTEWLDTGFDADTELLELINSGRLSTSKVGIYLLTLKERFRGEIVADLLCYLRLHVELSIRAKGLMMIRELGFRSDVGEETKAKLTELKFLEGSIGATGKLALKPLLRMSRKDLWQFYMLGG